MELQLTRKSSPFFSLLICLPCMEENDSAKRLLAPIGISVSFDSIDSSIFDTSLTYFPFDSATYIACLLIIGVLVPSVSASDPSSALYRTLEHTHAPKHTCTQIRRDSSLLISARLCTLPWTSFFSNESNSTSVVLTSYVTCARIHGIDLCLLGKRATTMVCDARVVRAQVGAIEYYFRTR